MKSTFPLEQADFSHRIYPMRNIWIYGTICIGLTVMVACSETQEADAGGDGTPEFCQVGTIRSTLFAPTENSETAGLSISPVSTLPATKT
jgi:hypothetical protein